jgi:hypothetical protein
MISVGDPAIPSVISVDHDPVKCESQEQPVTPVSSILEPVYYKTTVEGQEATLTFPFTCAKYRANVRVVDFRPRKIEDFATWRKSTESDVLSDYSSDSDSGSDDLNRELQDGDTGDEIWEWRFALQLEGVDPKSKGEKERFWAVVDNIEAQQLTGLDACKYVFRSPMHIPIHRAYSLTRYENHEASLCSTDTLNQPP